MTTQTNLISCIYCGGEGSNYGWQCCTNFIDGYCCHREISLTETCSHCDGSGVIEALPKFHDVDLKIDNSKLPF